MSSYLEPDKVEQILGVERAAKTAAYSEESELTGEEMRGFHEQVFEPVIRYEIATNPSGDGEYLEPPEKGIEELHREAMEFAGDWRLRPATDEATHHSISMMVDSSLYSDVEERVEETTEKGVDRFDGIVGIDRKGSPFATAASIHYDLPIHFCRKPSHRDEVYWLTEKPELDRVLIVDDVIQRGNARKAVESELEDAETSFMAKKQEALNSMMPEEKHVLY